MVAKFSFDRMFFVKIWKPISGKHNVNGHEYFGFLVDIFTSFHVIYSKLGTMPSEDIRYMHFPALARNGPPTTFQLTSPKDLDSSIGVWYVIQNKWGAKFLIGDSLPRPVTAAKAAQLMAGTGANPPSQWVQQAAFNLDTFMADVLPVKTEAKAAFPRFKKEPLNKVKTELSGTAGVLAPTTPYQPKINLKSEEPIAAKGRLIKRSLFHGDSNSNSNSNSNGSKADDNGGDDDDDDDDDYIKQWEWATEKPQDEDLVTADYGYDQDYCEEQVEDEVEYDFEPMSQSSGKSAASSSSSSSKMATYVPSTDLDESPMAKKTRTRTRNVKYQ